MRGPNLTVKISEFDRKRISKLTRNTDSIILQGLRSRNLTNSTNSIDTERLRARNFSRIKDSIDIIGLRAIKSKRNTDSISIQPNPYRSPTVSRISKSNLTSQLFLNHVQEKSIRVKTQSDTKLNKCKILIKK